MLVPISLSSKIYDDILLKLRESYPNVCVLYIEEINNDNLLRKFNQFTTNNDATEAFGWHGTSYENALLIAEKGFNPALNMRSAYGKGTYIAKHAHYSKSYAPPTNHGDISSMLYCKFAYKKLTRGSNIDPVNAGCDNVSTPSIFVVPNADAVLPLYLVAFYKNE